MSAFARKDVFPSWFVNSIQRFLSLTASGFFLSLKDSTHIRVLAGPEEEAAIIAISGLWRYSEASVNRAHPGGAAGTWDIYVVTKANAIVSSPAPGTDDTDYSFELRIVELGKTPAIEAGVVDAYRHVGSLLWSGTEITELEQFVPGVHRHAGQHAQGASDPLSPIDIGAVPASSSVARDLLQAGIVSSAAWGIVLTQVGESGALRTTGPSVAGVAWLPDTTGAGLGLVRTVTEPVSLPNTVPPALPVAGKFMCVGVEIGLVGASVQISLVSGAEAASRVLAEAARPAISAGKVRIRDAIIQNVAGVFSIAVQQDRRPWAAGAYAYREGAESSPVATTVQTALAAVTQRVECSGGPIKATFKAGPFPEEKGQFCQFVMHMDGAQFGPAVSSAAWSAEEFEVPLHWDFEKIVPAGTHLFELLVATNKGSCSIAAGYSLTIEQKQLSAANGFS